MLTAFLLRGAGGPAAGPHLFRPGPLRGPLWVGLIVGGIRLIARGGGRGRGRFRPERAAGVPAERYAGGEISTDEHLERRSHPCGSGR